MSPRTGASPGRRAPARAAHAKTRAQAPATPRDAHEWVSFEDPDEERTWVFDVTFLLSSWKCIYGEGCQGVLTEAAPELEHGCCSYGAHLVDAQDARRVRAAADRLAEDQWQFKKRARGKPLRLTRSGEVVTRITEGACIFLNRPGFPGGAGCALHRAALESGRQPLELKPEVCWQLPVRRQDETTPDGRVVSTVRQWDRSDWGPGGDEFHWWCTEGPEAFVGKEPVFKSLEPELVALVGRRVFDMLVSYLRRRTAPATPLPHPAVRRR